MKNKICAYFLSLIGFLILDSIWIGLVAQNFYKQNIGHLMAENFLLIPAVLFYLLYFIGIYFFVIKGSSELNSVEFIKKAMLFGLVCYATYDLTNLATLKNFSVLVCVVDMLWGTIATTIGALIYKKVLDKLNIKY